MLIPLDGLSSEGGLRQLHENLDTILSHISSDDVYVDNIQLSKYLASIKCSESNIEPDINFIQITDTDMLVGSGNINEKYLLKRDSKKRITEIKPENGRKITIVYK